METVEGHAPEVSAPVPEVEAPAATRVDRRSLLRWPVTAAMAALGGALLAACDFTSAPFDRRIHLLKRLTYGPTPAARDRITAIGETAWLNEQLAPQTPRPDRRSTPRSPRSPPCRRPRCSSSPTTRTATPRSRPHSCSSRAVIRSTESPAQLLERMVEFWSDHFNVPVQDETVKLLKIVEDRDVDPALRAREVQGPRGAVGPQPGDALLPRQLPVVGRRDQRELRPGAASSCTPSG